MWRLIRVLVRPYLGTLFVIFLAMAAETLMSLAGPWPLKIILDNVVGSHHLPAWFDHFLGTVNRGLGPGKMKIAALAAILTILIAAIGALASYIDNYYTTSVGQWVAHDLRMQTYHHLQRLSLAYYDSHQTGALLSTITDDIQTIQSFALLGHPGDSGGPFHHCRNARPDVLAQLGLCPGGRGGHAFFAAIRIAI